jgi:hydrogenase-4 transcriptional activator
VRHIITVKRRELKLAEPPELAPGAMEHLLAYGWPGNVRELQNVLERALISRPDAPLTFDELEARGRPRPEPVTAIPTTEMTLNETLTHYLRGLLQQTGGRINGPQGAAALAGVHPSTLRGKLRRYGVPFGRGS